MKLAMVFPGQGSQSVGMLQAYAGLPELETTRAEAREALGEEFVRLLDEGPAGLLDLTVNTQPGMLTAGVAAYRAWRALGGPGPEIVAGHSLGEYAALVAAGALGFRDALRLVRFRAEAMQEAVPPGQGAMAAVLGLDDDAVRAACLQAERASEAREVAQAVNFNAPGQVVIAGHKAAVARALEFCKSAGAKRAVALPVSAPFHSSLMQPAAERLRARLAEAPFSPPSVMLLNNVDVADEREPERIKDALVRQAAAPVRWAEIVRRMAALGVTHVLECGPGKVLAGLARRIDARLKCHALADRASLEQTLASLQAE